MPSEPAPNKSVEEPLSIITHLDSQARFWRRGFFLTNALIAVAIILMAITLIRVEKTLDEVTASTQSHADCARPGGDCFKRAQNRTTNAVNRVVDANHNGLLDIEEIKRLIFLELKALDVPVPAEPPPLPQKRSSTSGTSGTSTASGASVEDTSRLPDKARGKAKGHSKNKSIAFR